MSNTNANVETIVEGTKSKIEYVKWAIIAFMLLSIIIVRINLPIEAPARVLFFFSLAFFGWIHGSQRYGLKNMLIWFVITWIISNGLEGLSVKTGFPFGHYHYTAPGPRILDVPVFIMVAYFGIVYTAWTVTQALTGYFSQKIAGVWKFLLPITTAMVMTQWDVSTDSAASTVAHTWIWENGGEFFGVPVSNYAGWVLVVYLFMQVFTLFIANKNLDISKNNVTSKKVYWFQATIVYMAMGLGVVLESFIRIDHVEIFRSMALVCVFTVVFTTYIAMMRIKTNKELT